MLQGGKAILVPVAAALLAILALRAMAGEVTMSSWIMANTRMPVPTCPAHCLTAKQSNVGFSPCSAATSNASAAQEWSYEPSSGAIKLRRSSRCLAYTSSKRMLKLATCKPENRAQQWMVDAAAATISIRSSTTTMYLAMASSSSSSGSSWREAMLMEPAGNSTGNRIVSLVPFGSPFSSSASMVAARSSSAGNLVVNGGFELSSYETNDRIELAAGDSFGSCGWDIVHGRAELVSSSGRYDWSMHLLADTTIVQPFETNSSGYYVLSFLLRAPTADACDGQLQVRVTPSSLVGEIVVKPDERRDYWTTKSYAFQAAAGIGSNLSFHSLLCDVLIDDVRVLPLSVDVRVLPLTVATSTSQPAAKRLSSAAMAAVIAGASIAAFLAGCLCAAVIIFRLLRPTVAVSETNDCGSSISQQQLERLHDLKRVPTFAGVRIVSFAQIDKATHGFSTVIGKGRLGYVYLTDFDDGTRGASKRIFKMFQLIEMDFFDTVKRLGKIVHPNIVKLIAFSRDHGEQILVFEYVPGVNLYQRLHASRQPSFPWNTRIAVALDVALALEFLHHVASPRVVHGRVKSSNVFVTKEGKVKLGHCSFVSQHPRAELDGYMDPAGDSGDKGDVYSFGVLLLELVSGRQPPFGGQYRELEVDRKLLALEGRHQLKGLDQILRMANACLHDEPEERPSMAEVVELLRQCTVLEPQCETTPETRSRPNSPA